MIKVTKRLVLSYFQKCIVCTINFVIRTSIPLCYFSCSLTMKLHRFYTYYIIYIYNVYKFNFFLCFFLNVIPSWVQCRSKPIYILHALLTSWCWTAVETLFKLLSNFFFFIPKIKDTNSRPNILCNNHKGKYGYLKIKGNFYLDDSM